MGSSAGQSARRAGQLHATARRKRAGPIDLGGLDRLIGFAVRRAQVWIFQDFRRALKGLDMTPAQFSVLTIVAANPGLAQARVAEALAIERARLVQMLDRLEVRGLIRRARSPADRRSHALSLTAGGAALLDRLGRLVDEHEHNVVARIGARQKDDLLRILAPFSR
jgi:DNA-binding MarR family transcriptional regulator